MLAALHQGIELLLHTRRAPPCSLACGGATNVVGSGCRPRGRQLAVAVAGANFTGCGRWCASGRQLSLAELTLDAPARPILGHLLIVVPTVHVCPLEPCLAAAVVYHCRHQAKPRLLLSCEAQLICRFLVQREACEQAAEGPRVSALMLVSISQRRRHRVAFGR